MPVKYTHGFFFAVAILLLFSSCRNYYKVTSLSSEGGRNPGVELDSLKSADRYFILRNGTEEAYQMKSIEVSTDRKTALLSLDSVSEAHKYYIANKDVNGPYSKMNSHQKQVVSEVHTFMRFDSAARLGSYTLPLARVQRIDVLQRDAKRSTNSYVLGGLIVVLTVLTGLGIYLLNAFNTGE